MNTFLLVLLDVHATSRLVAIVIMALLQLPVILPTFQVPLILLTNVITLAIGPQRRVLQFAFSVPVLFVLFAQSLYREWERGWGLHYGLNCFVMSLAMVWVDWMLLNSPGREDWMKLDVRQGILGKRGCCAQGGRQWSCEE